MFLFLKSSLKAILIMKDIYKQQQISYHPRPSIVGLANLVPWQPNTVITLWPEQNGVAVPTIQRRPTVNQPRLLFAHPRCNKQVSFSQSIAVVPQRQHRGVEWTRLSWQLQTSGKQSKLTACPIILWCLARKHTLHVTITLKCNLISTRMELW